MRVCADLAHLVGGARVDGVGDEEPRLLSEPHAILAREGPQPPLGPVLDPRVRVDGLMVPSAIDRATRSGPLDCRGAVLVCGQNALRARRQRARETRQKGGKHRTGIRQNRVRLQRFSTDQQQPPNRDQIA